MVLLSSRLPWVKHTDLQLQHYRSLYQSVCTGLLGETLSWMNFNECVRCPQVVAFPCQLSCCRMCIIFLYVNNEALKGTYSLILANNRDEHLERPTKPADFWSESCISGLDQQPGREGGTWLGLSKNNKISTLLNILQPNVELDKKGRGSLVTDFLTGSQTLEEYLTSIRHDGHLYNGFNLLCMERRQSLWHGSLYSNQDRSIIHRIGEGYTVLGNSIVTRPWQKTLLTRPVFQCIVEKHNAVDQEVELYSQLISMLNNKAQYIPDLVLAGQGTHLPDVIVRERSAVCVDSPSISYGSRTNTVILVDHEGNCTYIERTMQEPIDPYKPVWNTVRHEFRFNEPTVPSPRDRGTHQI